MMVAPVDTEFGFRPGRPNILFDAIGYPALAGFEIGPDGQRFLMARNLSMGVEAQHKTILLLNWLDELERLVPTD